jgi:deoxyhypusine synthase
MSVRRFIDEHFFHFNAGMLKRTAQSLDEFLKQGGKIFLTLAGAMSTAQIGRSLSKMIRTGHIAGISCTGANLEEDLFYLVAKNSYKPIPDYNDLSPEDELALLHAHYNRVTDVCIPEEEAFRKLEHHLLQAWQQSTSKNESKLPHQYFYELLLSGNLVDSYEADPNNSWLLAAAECNVPLFVPGWEDSTMGNIFAARCLEGKVSQSCVQSGIGYMMALVDFYENNATPLGFLQSGGGIAGDFPICVVPLLHQDLEREVPLWSWFAQITDATASYGGYSGAPPNEKITWGKLGIDTPKFNIQSDATIVLPLLFGYILDF